MRTSDNVTNYELEPQQVTNDKWQMANDKWQMTWTRTDYFDIENVKITKNQFWKVPYSDLFLPARVIVICIIKLWVVLTKVTVMAKRKIIWIFLWHVFPFSCSWVYTVITIHACDNWNVRYGWVRVRGNRGPLSPDLHWYPCSFCHLTRLQANRS